jgi:hypothetical protein
MWGRRRGSFRGDMIWFTGLVAFCRGFGVVVGFFVDVFSEGGFFRGVRGCLRGDGPVGGVVPSGEGLSRVFTGELILDWICWLG